MAKPSTLHSQESDFKLVEILLPHVRKSFVDIGAEKGSFARFLMEHGFTGAIFEPLPKHATALASLTRGTNNRYFDYAVDQTDGAREFHVACDERGEPLDFFHSLQRLDNDARVHHNKSIPVTCRSLASLHAAGLIPDNLGVLKIDTEGNDLRVLRGLGPVRSDVIICEFFTSGVYAGWTDAEPLGLVNQARQSGNPHCVAIRRRGTAELISLNPDRFTDQEWGNLVFMTDSVLAAARKGIAQHIVDIENRLFRQLEAVQAKPKRRWFSRRASAEP